MEKNYTPFANIALLDCAVFEDPARFEEVFRQMNAERQKKILPLKREEDRRLSLGAGYLAARLLEAFADEQRASKQDPVNVPSQESQSLTVLHDRDGRPKVLYKDGTPAPLFLSLSHSGTYAEACLSSSPIGVDIERLSEARMEIANRFYSENEKAYLQQCADKPRAFYEIWCKKECRIKAEGFRDLTELPVFPPPEGTAFHEYSVPGYSCYAYTRGGISPRII